MTEFIQTLLAGTFLEQYQYFHFMRPYWLLVALPFFIIYRHLKVKDDALSSWRSKMSNEVLAHLTVNDEKLKWLSPSKLYIPFAIVAVVVLSGPSWKQQVSPLYSDESVLVIALDVSETMNQNDVQPSRLIRAKQKIEQLLTARGSGNTALIAFSGTAHIVMPVTDDIALIKHFLNVLSTDVLPKQGQNTELVLKKANNMLVRSGVPSTLLLISDNITENATRQFEHYFNTNKHQLVVWGIGNEHANSEYFTPLAKDELENLANRANGSLVTYSHDTDDVEAVKHSINQKLVVLQDDSQPWFDEGYPLLFIIAALQLFWFRRGWSLPW